MNRFSRLLFLVVCFALTAVSVEAQQTASMSAFIDSPPDLQQLDRIQRDEPHDAPEIVDQLDSGSSRYGLGRAVGKNEERTAHDRAPYLTNSIVFVSTNAPEMIR